jgi:NTE family protein
MRLSCLRTLTRTASATLLTVAMSACATVYNLPTNVPLGANIAGNDVGRPVPIYDDDLLLALSFSGGGTRAAAFSFGVLTELDRIRSASNQTKSLLDRVDFISGVSGGSVTAAYFGLKRREALIDFRERFLLRNAEEDLRTRVSLVNLSRALGGGVNDVQFTEWLDQNLFDGARYEAFREERRPRVWINASDIFNRTPFVFGKTSFDALCSDLSAFRISEAVSASAAVPLAFAPIVLRTFPGGCTTPLPPWLERARNNPTAQPLLRSFAEAMERYRDGSMKFVKLLDGGLVDNFGLTGFSLGLLAAQHPYEPMTERQAVRVRRIMFVVADAGRGVSGDFVQTVEGPTGTQLVSAVADTAIDSSTRLSYAAFSALLTDWVARVKSWRCGLSAADRARLALSAGWKCNDLSLYIDLISFGQLGEPRTSQLNAIPTSFSLPAQDIDLLITSGADALRRSSTFQAFRRGL